MKKKFNTDVLDRLMLKHNIKSKKELSDFLDNKVGYAAIISWYRKTNPNTPSQQIIEIMSIKFGVDKDEFYIQKQDNEDNEVVNYNENQKIAVLSMRAGFGAEGSFDDSFKVDYYLQLPKSFLGNIKPRYARVIKCLGDSMEPEFNDGDYLLIEMLENRHFIKRSGIYLVRVGDVIYIQRVEFLPNGDARLISINPKYPPLQPLKELGMEYKILACVYGKISVKIGSSFQFDPQGIL